MIILLLHLTLPNVFAFFVK
uniref:Uncharacterized protein n=1 Tax=Anguilla anguilla TaxID=7936 RepID=A0A0E9PS53_ANGAN